MTSHESVDESLNKQGSTADRADCRIDVSQQLVAVGTLHLYVGRGPVLLFARVSEDRVGLEAQKSQLLVDGVQILSSDERRRIDGLFHTFAKACQCLQLLSNPIAVAALGKQFKLLFVSEICIP